MKCFFYLVVIVFWGCQSPSDKILEDFKRIDKSLDNTNDNINNVNQQLALLLQNDSGLAAIKTEAANAFAYIEGVKQKIKEASGKNASDEVMMDLTVSNRIMLKEKKADSVFSGLKKFQNLVLLKSTQDTVKLQINQKLHYLTDTKDLNETFFKNIPPVAALTMLSKFQNDIKNCENIVLMSFINKKN